MLNMYGVSNMVSRTLGLVGPSAITIALFALEKYGFQLTTGPHWKPLKYRVSLRGSGPPGSTTTGAAVGATVGAGAEVGAGAAVGAAGASVAAGVHAPISILSAITTHITGNNRFIFILLFLLMNIVYSGS